MNKVLLAFVRISALLLLLAAAPAPAHAGLTDGLVGYWTLDGKDVSWSTGTVTDKSGQGNSGKVVSMATTTSPALGKIGQGLKFNGITGPVISLGTNKFGSPSEFTLTAWLKTASTSGNKTILGEYQGGVCGDSLLAVMTTSGVVRYNDGASGNNSSTAVVTDNKWHHVVYTYTAAQGKMYVDGVAQSDSTAAAWRNTCSLDVRIGGAVLSGQPFEGILDDVRIYNRALQATEVRQLYALGQAKYATSPTSTLTSALVGYWTMDGKNVNWTTGTVTDSSGQGNNGSVVSMSTTTSPAYGKIGQGLRFDGVDDFVNINAGFGTLPFTVCAWFYPKNSADGSTYTLFSTYFNSTNYHYLAISGAPFQLVAASRAGVSGASSATQTGVSGNSWNFGCGVWQSSTSRTAYLNGVAGATDTTDRSPSAAIISQIGARSGAILFNGVIDDVRVYYRALSSQDIMQLYNLGKANFATSPVNSLTSGLVGYWTMDGKNMNWTTGTVGDISGQGNNGKVVSMSTTTSPVAGKIGQGLKFDGVDDYVRVENNSVLDVTSAYTVSMWANLATTTQYYNFITRGAGEADDLEIYGAPGAQGLTVAHNRGNGGTFAYCANANGTTDTDGAGWGSFPVKKWTHLTVTYDGTNWRVYFNGALQGAACPSGVVHPSDTNKQWLIGTGEHSGFDLLGYDNINATLDDVRIYNRVLSAQEVRNLYGVGKATNR